MSHSRGPPRRDSQFIKRLKQAGGSPAGLLQDDSVLDKVGMLLFEISIGSLRITDDVRMTGCENKRLS